LLVVRGDKLNIIIAGVGGQGTILASRLRGDAALLAGMKVKGSETIGMAQRGGSVTSHLRIFKEGEPVFSPLVSPGQADLVLALELNEAVRAWPFLHSGAALIALDELIGANMPRGGDWASAEDIRACLKTSATLMETGAVKARYGKRCLNVALLGLALREGKLPFSLALMEEALKKRLKPQYVEQNLAVLKGEF
jgi:indolepyruvate ferredoxin oxidoreductase beta subunit